MGFIIRGFIWDIPSLIFAYVRFWGPIQGSTTWFDAQGFLGFRTLGFWGLGLQGLESQGYGFGVWGPRSRAYVGIRSFRFTVYLVGRGS